MAFQSNQRLKGWAKSLGTVGPVSGPIELAVRDKFAGYYRKFGIYRSFQRNPCLHSAGERVVEGGRDATERTTLVRVLPQLEGPGGPAPAKQSRANFS